MLCPILSSLGMCKHGWCWMGTLLLICSVMQSISFAQGRDLATNPDPKTSSSSAQNQNILKQEKQARSRWQLVVGGGRRNDNDRWDDLVAGLAAGGYDDGQCQGWFGPCPYPDGGAQHKFFHLAMVVDPWPKWGVRLFWNDGDFVQGTGYDEESYSDSYLSVGSSLETFGLIVEYVPSPAFRVGIGPTWHFLETTSVAKDWENEVVKFSSSSIDIPAFVFSAAVNLAVNRPLFLHLSVQQHFMDRQEIETFDSLPVFEMEMTHMAVILGFGCRF